MQYLAEILIIVFGGLTLFYLQSILTKLSDLNDRLIISEEKIKNNEQQLDKVQGFILKGEKFL